MRAPSKGEKFVTRQELIFWIEEWERMKRHNAWHRRWLRWWVTLLNQPAPVVWARFRLWGNAPVGGDA